MRVRKIVAVGYSNGATSNANCCCFDPKHFAPPFYFERWYTLVPEQLAGSVSYVAVDRRGK